MDIRSKFNIGDRVKFTNRTSSHSACKCCEQDVEAVEYIMQQGTIKEICFDGTVSYTVEVDGIRYAIAEEKLQIAR